MVNRTALPGCIKFYKDDQSGSPDILLRKKETKIFADKTHLHHPYNRHLQINPLHTYPPIRIFLYPHNRISAHPPHDSFVNSAFNSAASSGFILPPRIRRSWRLRMAPSNSFISSSVSGTSCGTCRGLRFGSRATNV